MWSDRCAGSMPEKNSKGEGTITLDAKDHSVRKGSGIYLGPSESATIKPAGAAPLKLFHLVVPHLPGE
jgi:mannose-6-phosphate isomerase-like protein (cupin superfamily)